MAKKQEEEKNEIAKAATYKADCERASARYLVFTTKEQKKQAEGWCASWKTTHLQASPTAKPPATHRSVDRELCACDVHSKRTIRRIRSEVSQSKGTIQRICSRHTPLLLACLYSPKLLAPGENKEVFEGPDADMHAFPAGSQPPDNREVSLSWTRGKTEVRRKCRGHNQRASSGRDDSHARRARSDQEGHLRALCIVVYI